MKTVDKILKKFRKTINDLENTANKQLETAVKIDDEIEQKLSDREFAMFESNRATDISENLKKLIGDHTTD